MIYENTSWINVRYRALLSKAEIFFLNLIVAAIEVILRMLLKVEKSIKMVSMIVDVLIN